MGKEATVDQFSTVILCHHCGNKTRMHRVAYYDHIVEYEYLDYGITFCTQWALFFCPVCLDVTLRRLDWDDNSVDERGELIVSSKDIYPVCSDRTEGVPEVIHKAFEAALRVKNIDSAICILALRRTLEKLSKDQGATGRTLYEKTKDLAQKKILPLILDEMADVLRELGNAAAHADDIKFDEEMVSQLIEFTQTIINYVYVLPQQLRRIQEKMNEKTLA